MKNLLKSKIFLAAMAIAMLIVMLVPVVIFAAVVDQNSIGGIDIGTAGKIKFQGSTTLGPIIVAAAPLYNTAKGATIIEHTVTDWIIQNGSGDGITAAKYDATLSRTKTDIGMSSKNLSTAELDVLNDIYIARDAVVIIVNNSVDASITEITKAQLDGIYEGTITNWSAIKAGTPSMTIIPRARNLSSGTRASLIDQCGISKSANDDDLTLTPGTENYTIMVTHAAYPRCASASVMTAAIDNVASTGQIGYVGLGGDVGANLRALKVVDSWGQAWSSSDINCYAKNPAHPEVSCYPLSRFLHLCTEKNTTYTPANSADIDAFITWIRATDGAGQGVVASKGYLKLIPNQDVGGGAGGVPDNFVDVSDLVAVGNQAGWTGIPHAIRADVAGGVGGIPDGAVDVSDLVSVGNWAGVMILPAG